MASTTDSKGVITTSLITDIADSIRNLNGESTEYLPSQMPTKITGLYLDRTIKFLDNNEIFQIESIKSGNAVAKPATNPINGIFMGWTNSPSASSLITFPFVPSESMNLYSKYAELSSDYQAVQYIESTGEQYIEFGQNFSSAELKYVEIKFSPTAVTGTSPSGGYNGIMGVNSNPQLGFYQSGWCVGNAGSSSPYVPVVGTVYVVTWNKISGGDYRVDDLPTGIARAGTLTTRLCWIETGPSNCKNKVYEVKIKDRNTENVLFYAVPCYRKSDSKPGMYDIVNNVFYTNSGSGEDFTLGPDIN